MHPTHHRLYPGILLALTLLVSACAGDAEDPYANPQATDAARTDLTEHLSTLPDALREGLEAHGGLDTWRSFPALQFDFNRAGGTETQHIDLSTRRTHWIGDGFTLGFDGDSVWVSPSEDAFFGNPRF